MDTSKVIVITWSCDGTWSHEAARALATIGHAAKMGLAAHQPYDYNNSVNPEGARDGSAV
jgi:hypothetical protein